MLLAGTCIFLHLMEFVPCISNTGSKRRWFLVREKNQLSVDAFLRAGMFMRSCFPVPCGVWGEAWLSPLPNLGWENSTQGAPGPLLDRWLLSASHRPGPQEGLHGICLGEAQRM